MWQGRKLSDGWFVNNEAFWNRLAMAMEFSRPEEGKKLPDLDVGVA